MQSKDSTEDVARQYCFHMYRNFQFISADPADDLHGNHLQLIEPNVPTEYPRDTDFSEDASSSSSDEQLQGQGNGNPNVLVFTFTVYLYQIDHRHHANAPAIVRTSSINQGNSQ